MADANGFVRVPISEQEPLVRAKNFDEVCLGYTEEEAVVEAARCLNCKNPRCVSGCPVNINIPGFVTALKDRDFAKSYRVFITSCCLRTCMSSGDTV